MILSDNELRAYLADGRLRIEPMPDFATQLQPASIDLRLGSDFRTFNHTRYALVDPLAQDGPRMDELTTLIHCDDGLPFIVHPGEFVLGSTREWVDVPDNLIGRLEGRSSYGRLGIIVHSTAGYIDPGFRGTLTLEISNQGRIAVALYPGQRVCQIVLEELSSAAGAPYGEHRGSKYNDQREPTMSRLHLERQ